MDKFKNITPSESIVIFERTKQMQKDGIDVISLSVGDTHFKPPKSIYNNIYNPPNSFSHYTESKGIPELRSEIASRYNTSLDNVIITNGVKQGLYYVINSLPSDKVCVIEPAWLGYKATISLCGKSLKKVSFHSDWLEDLEKTDFGALILCSPNNPNGKVFSTQEMCDILSICQKKEAFIIFDNIYYRFDYSDKYIKSIKSVLSYDKLILTGGFSKSHAVTGFRIGYVICNNEDILNRINLLHQNIATCAPSISQYGLLGLDKHDGTIDEYKHYYKNNRDLVHEIIPDLKKYAPDGGFYYFINISDFGFSDGKKFCEKLLNEKGVAVIPGSAYGNFKSYIRMSFSIDSETLVKGLLRFKEFIYE